MDGNPLIDGNQALRFIDSARFRGSADEVRTVTSEGTARLEIDFDGDKVADFAIRFDTPMHIVASDLVL